MTVNARHAILADLRSFLGRTVAEDAGLTFSHIELPPVKFETVTIRDGRLTLPTLENQIVSVGYDTAKSAKDLVRQNWPKPFVQTLLNAQRWARGEGALPELPPSAREALGTSATESLKAVFADQMPPPAAVPVAPEQDLGGPSILRK